MARQPKPWWRKDRKSWFVTVDGKRDDLGPNREAALQQNWPSALGTVRPVSLCHAPNGREDRASSDL
jgi:hypothetical protein